MGLRSGAHGVVQAQTAKPTQPGSQPAVNAPLEGGDSAARSNAVLAHLNAVLRFYRDSQAPIQKTGEPSDAAYRVRAVTEAAQIASFAFQSANAEAALIAQTSPQGNSTGNQSQRLRQTLNDAEQRIATLKTQDTALAEQLAAASPKKKAALQQEREQVEGELELRTAMADALGKILSMAGTTNDTGFAAQVAQLEHSAPGISANKATAVAPTLESLSAAQSAGVTSQAVVLFELLHSREAIDNLAKETDHLHRQALALRTPLIGLLKQTIAQGQALSQSSPGPAAPSAKALPKAGNAESPTGPLPTGENFKELTATFKALSGATVPLSQEILTLEQNQVTLQAWSTAVNEEYAAILRSLLTRVMFIAIALLVIFGLGEAWRRATKRYVHDVRRRRQLLVVRRLVIGFLSGLVLIFGLVTQFSSLATFAGFITAGIAVALQTVLLSVAAYFFIVGRYGIKVGDRVTITGVTGDVVEVGLLRFYMMELAGSGMDLFPTGRVVVFSNAVLFQAGTPLYKQMPGTEYAWHELIVRLSSDADYRTATQEILKSLQNVYEEYRGQIEQQHRHLESRMDSALDAPDIQSNLQLVDGGLQLWARFPVMLRQAAAIDEKISESLLQLISTDPKVKAAVNTPPIIKAAVKG